MWPSLTRETLRNYGGYEQLTVMFVLIDLNLKLELVVSKNINFLLLLSQTSMGEAAADLALARIDHLVGKSVIREFMTS